MKFEEEDVVKSGLETVLESESNESSARDIFSLLFCWCTNRYNFFEFDFFITHYKLLVLIYYSFGKYHGFLG